MNSEISLEKFLCLEKELLKEFSNYYGEGIKTNPEIFPDKLPAEDWLEQLDFFHAQRQDGKRDQLD